MAEATARVKDPVRTGTRGADAQAHERVALIDNIKGILIILVVAGHIAHPVHNDNPAVSCIFDLIYLFHMPLFVFISGLLAKGAWRDGRLATRRIVSFFALGLLFQLALLTINGTVDDSARWLRFSSAPWYIVSMGWWYLLTPVLARLGAARGLVLSVAASMVFGLVDLSDGALALARTAAFLPWFALGYYLPVSVLARIRRTSAATAAVVGAGVLIALRVTDPHAFDGFFRFAYGDNPLRHLPADVALRLVAGAAAAIAAVAAIRIAPTRRCALSTLGQRTLQIYVLHRLARAWLTFHTGFYELPLLEHQHAGTLVIGAVTAATVALCAWSGFTPLFRALSGGAWLEGPRRLQHALATAPGRALDRTLPALAPHLRASLACARRLRTPRPIA